MNENEERAAHVALLRELSPELTQHQAEILYDVRRAGRAVYDGRARQAIGALEDAGLVDVIWNRKDPGEGGADPLWRITVTPAPQARPRLEDVHGLVRYKLAMGGTAHGYVISRIEYPTYEEYMAAHRAGRHAPEPFRWMVNGKGVTLKVTQSELDNREVYPLPAGEAASEASSRVLGEYHAAQAAREVA